MIKKTTSLILAFSGLILLATSVVLYIGPPSHVGHFSSWLCLGLPIHHWGAAHLNCGILFFLAMIVHIYFNWTLLVSYMKKRKKAGRTWAVPLALSLVITFFVSTGSFHHCAPMKQVMGFARMLKMELVREYGTPPYGSSGAFPVSVIARYMGWNPEAALKRLAESRIVVESPKQPLAEVAGKNHTTIGRIMDIMHPGGGAVPGDKQG